MRIEENQRSRTGLLFHEMGGEPPSEPSEAGAHGKKEEK